MPSPEWATSPYARVFATFPDDHPGVWADDALLAWYIRLLLPAALGWPLAPGWPRNIPADVEEALVSTGAIDDLGADRYTVHGLDALRVAEDRRNRAGGMARAKGPRDPATGRLMAAKAVVEPVAQNGGANRWPTAVGPTGGTTVSTTDEVDKGEYHHPSGGGGTPNVDSDPTHAPDAPAPARAEEGAVTVAERASMVRSHGPDDAPCDEPALHPLHHRWYAGVGWRCLICESTDTRTFRERVEAMVPGTVTTVTADDDERPF